MKKIINLVGNAARDGECFESFNITGFNSRHVPIVPVLVESWSGQVNSGPW